MWNQLQLPESLTVIDSARIVLQEFGNLKFGPDSDRITLDPSMAVEIAPQIASYADLLRRALYPIGVWDHQDRLYILIDDIGVVYIYDFRLWPLASSFDVAIKYIVERSVLSEERIRDLAKIRLADTEWELKV